jgi:alpha-D-xyloside xylohydrolase
MMPKSNIYFVTSPMHIGKQSERVTPLSFRSAPANASAIGALPVVPEIPLDIKAISWTLSARGISAQLPMTGDERIYGLGLDTDVFDMTDRRAICCPSDTPQDKMNYSHAPVPFYVSSRGYGVYVDTARYAWFYTGDIAPKTDALELSGTAQPALSTMGLYHPTTMRHKTMLIDVHPSRGVDIYIFAGPALRDAVQRYNLFSGGGAMPPMWGLGIHYRSESMMSAEDILALAKRLRQEKMPCDIWGLEAGWQSRVYSSSFMWDKDRFPDPDAFIRAIKAMNFHLNLWEHAFTNPVSPMFKPLKPWSGNYLVWGGLTPDFATAEARAIWTEHHDKIMFSKGIDGVKLDECDNQPYRAHPWSFPEASIFPSGMDGELMHTLFGELYQQTMLHPLAQRNIRTWCLVRNTFALASPLPFTIYSDSYDFKCYLRGICKQAFSGVMWVPEVRNANSVEELYRRVQMVIFAPMALVNCWYMKLAALVADQPRPKQSWRTNGRS